MIHSALQIFLTRKNLLKSIISYKIALKTNIWHVNKENIKLLKEDFRKIKLEEFSVEEIKESIQRLRYQINLYKKLLEDSNIKYFELFYEDLFCMLLLRGFA